MADDIPLTATEPRMLTPLCLQLRAGFGTIQDVTGQINRFYAKEGTSISIDPDCVYLMLREGAIILHGRDRETGQLLATVVMTSSQTFTSRIGQVHHLAIARSYASDERLFTIHARHLLRELIRRAREAHVQRLELRDQRARDAALELGFIDHDHHGLILSF